jgi:hypothetical protein
MLRVLCVLALCVQHAGSTTDDARERLLAGSRSLPAGAHAAVLSGAAQSVPLGYLTAQHDALLDAAAWRSLGQVVPLEPLDLDAAGAALYVRPLTGCRAA